MRGVAVPRGRSVCLPMNGKAGAGTARASQLECVAWPVRALLLCCSADGEAPLHENCPAIQALFMHTSYPKKLVWSIYRCRLSGRYQ